MFTIEHSNMNNQHRTNRGLPLTSCIKIHHGNPEESGVMKRRGTATTTCTEMSEEEQSLFCKSDNSTIATPKDMNRFVQIIVQKLKADLVDGNQQQNNNNNCPTHENKPFDIEAVAKLIRESVELGLSSSDHDNENDDNDVNSDAHSVRSSHISLSDESKASTNSNVTLQSFLGDATIEEVYRPEFWCADLEETLDREIEDTKEDDDVSKVSHLSDVMDSIANASISHDNCSEVKSKDQTESSKKSNNKSKRTPSSYQYKVKFTDITVREYPQILGENPGCSNGPSMAIGWEYREHPTLLLDAFEALRAPFRDSKKILLVPCEKHEKRLRRMGYSPLEIAEAVRRDNKSRCQRRQTVSNMAMLEALLSTKSKILRSLFFSLPRND